MASKERVFGSQLETAQVFIKETAAATKVFFFMCWLNGFVTPFNGQLALAYLQK